MRGARFQIARKVGPNILLCLLFGSSCSIFTSEGLPLRYLLPEGYVGWVRINFKRDAPLPPIDDGLYVLKFPLSGEVIVSNQTKTETVGTEFYYSSEDLRLTRIQPTSAGSVNVQDIDNLEEPRHYQFVGTYEEYLLYNSPFDTEDEDEDEPRIGLIKKEQLGN